MTIEEKTHGLFLGMTNANMKLVTASVLFKDDIIEPTANLDEGEFVVTRVVELAKLKDTLKRMFSAYIYIKSNHSN